LTIGIHVKRFYLPFVISAIIPVVATTWLAFGAFFLPRRNLEGRIRE
jgi:hypothetical protein